MERLQPMKVRMEKTKTFKIRADYTILTDLETYNLYFIEKYNSEDENEKWSIFDLVV